jgi:hypothetical protein
VVSAGLQIIELVIQLQRQPDQRVPVPCVMGCERPAHTRATQADLHAGILRDVGFVVIVEEGMAHHAAEDEYGQQSQAEGEVDGTQIFFHGIHSATMELRDPFTGGSTRPGLSSLLVTSTPGLIRGLR